MPTNPTTPELLSEEALKDIEARLHLTTDGDAVFVLGYVRALCQTVRALRAENKGLRDALEPLSQNGRLFTFHRNVEEGDYFECGLCNQEAKRWHEIQHHPNCRIQVAKNALAVDGEQP